MRIVLAIALMGPSLSICQNNPAQSNWQQFRGPNSSGVAAAGSALPVEFGAAKGVVWKADVPAGHSSPVIWGDRLFITSYDKAANRLEVLCLARRSGKILWRRPVPFEKLEKIHPVSSPASATPAVDGERVYVYFGSVGLMAFDFEGKQVWTVPLPPPQMTQSSGTSPILAGDLVLLNRDEAKEGYLLAVDRKSGKTVWKQNYPAKSGFSAESYSTPVIWRGQAVLHRSGFVDAYDLKDGARKWWAQAQTNGTSTVVVDKDTIYAAAWSTVGEADQIVPLPDFDALTAKYDKDGDGQISETEMPADLAVLSRPDTANVPGATVYVKKFFRELDGNHDGKLQKNEWDSFTGEFRKIVPDHGLVAIKPSGEGDVTAAIRWKEKTAVPETPSPLLYEERLYMVRNGGILTCLKAQSGEVLYRSRVGAGGPYYSSPIAAGGKIYISSGEGTVVVLAPGDKLDVLARNDLGEEIYATPAVADGVLYVRTSGHLYAFGDTAH